MKLINLIENKPVCGGLRSEHGLSFYVETQKHRLLIDTGASDAFLYNADMLGVDLSRVDAVILSHGHYDHTGGVLAFAQRNPQANIYLQKTAGAEYYHKDTLSERYIGIDKRILALPQVHLMDGNYVIDDGISVFTHVTGRKLWPVGNHALKQKTGEQFINDSFCHEQYVVLSEAGKKILISGCAHNGIVNILDTYRSLYGGAPDVVFSGFHMKKSSDYTETEKQNIRATGAELAKLPTIFYTGHCTSEAGYQLLHEIMGEQLRESHTGDQFQF